MFLFDLVPESVGSSAVGAVVGIVFFFVAVASGLFAFAMLRKTVKMAFRMVIVAVVLMIAIVGGVALYLFMKPKPQPYTGPARRPTVNSTR